MSEQKEKMANGKKCFSVWRFLAALGVAAMVDPASAHVSYYSLTDPFLSPGGVNGGSFSNFGWADGTTETLGDSHDLAQGTFFSFHLDSAKRVSITFSDSSGFSGRLNPAFSVYKGLLPDESHDDTLADPLNPMDINDVKTASPVDNGVISPFRNTATINYVGQFNALDSWSMANESGTWAVIEYVTHIAPTGGDSVSLNNYLFQAGDYTIAASGGHLFPATRRTQIDGTISFVASPVPLPASVWLFGTAMAGFAVNRRKRVV